MEESYIRGVNQEIIRYLKDIKSSLANQAQDASVDEVESKLDSLSTTITSLSTVLANINSGITDMKALLQEISGKLSTTGEETT